MSGYYWDTNRTSKDRNMLFVGSDTDSKKEMTSYDRRTMVRMSRYLVKNTGIAKAAIRDLALYSIGDGLVPQAQTDDESWNDQAEAMFQEWTKKADIREQLNLTELCHTWSRSIDVDGDVFVLPIQTKQGAKLQTIRSHRIHVTNYPENIFDGVKLDTSDRPLYYVIDDNKRRISAFNLLHLCEPHNSDGIRSEPSTAHAINNLFDVREILALEKKGVKLNSAIATVIKTPMPTEAAGFLGRQNSTTQNGQSTTLESIMGGGIVPRLAPGEDISSFTSSRPSPTFDGFIEHFIRDFCVGIGLPFEFVWNTAALGGTAQRFVLEKAQRRFEQRQQTIAKAMTRIWQWYIATQIQAGLLPNNPQFWRIDWQFPKKITVDAGRQSKATIEEIKMGLETYRGDYASRGKDWKKQLKEKAIEEAYINELADEYGITPDRISQKSNINISETKQVTEEKDDDSE